MSCSWNAAYAGHIFATVMSGTRIMKEFGLTGIPVQRIENASATGSAALREAYLAVSAGHYDTAMVLGFDKMTTMIQSGTAGTAPENMEHAILPAGFFARARRRSTARRRRWWRRAWWRGR